MEGADIEQIEKKSADFGDVSAIEKYNGSQE